MWKGGWNKMVEVKAHQRKVRLKDGLFHLIPVRKHTRTTSRLYRVAYPLIDPEDWDSEIVESKAVAKLKEKYPWFLIKEGKY